MLGNVVFPSFIWKMEATGSSKMFVPKGGITFLIIKLKLT